MLAQNFKSPADLRITAAEFGGLIQVLGMLERDEVKHVPVEDTMFKNGDLPVLTKDFLFNMDNIYTVAACGTAACIAGTSDLFCGTKFMAEDFCLRDNLPEQLLQLFCPNTYGNVRWADITTEQAATALRNYLTNGEPRWEEVLA